MNSIERENGIIHIYNNDKRLAKIIDSSEPYALKPRKNYYLLLVRAIVGQQLSMIVAQIINGRFLDFFGGDPAPEKIAAASHEALRALGLSNAKVKYIKDLAEKIISGEVHFRGIGKKSDEEIIEELTKVKGIGVWTVHMFLIFTLARPNILPVGDLGIKRAIKNLYELKELPDENKIRRISKKNGWEPYNSIACWYLWRSLEMKPENVIQV